MVENFKKIAAIFCVIGKKTESGEKNYGICTKIASDFLLKNKKVQKTCAKIPLNFVFSKFLMCDIIIV